MNMTNPQTKDPRHSMNRMYKVTRHVYDASRKFYLLGRDHLINELKPANGEHIIEIGCGTARNLIKLSQIYPNAYFYGIDASDEMLKTARQSLLKQQLASDIKLAQGLAQTFDPAALFALERRPDKIVFSYSLSMIPDAPQAIDHALDLLPPGGEIHIVDFGNLARQPTWFKGTLETWLALFHVRHDPALPAYIKTLAGKGLGTLKMQSLYKDYAYYIVFKKA